VRACLYACVRARACVCVRVCVRARVCVCVRLRACVRAGGGGGVRDDRELTLLAPRLRMSWRVVRDLRVSTPSTASTPCDPLPEASWRQRRPRLSAGGAVRRLCAGEAD
jgi:hypothetical protein